MGGAIDEEDSQCDMGMWDGVMSYRIIIFCRCVHVCDLCVGSLWFAGWSRRWQLWRRRGATTNSVTSGLLATLPSS